MAIQLIGNSGTISEIESNTRASRTVLRSNDFGIGGVFSLVCGSTTVISSQPSATQIVASFRNSGPPGTAGAGTLTIVPMALIRSVYITVNPTSVAFSTPSAFQVDLNIVRDYVTDASGGVSATLISSGYNFRLRSNFNVSPMTIRYSGSGTALSAGTGTVDTQPIASLVGQFSTIATGQSIIPGLPLWNTESESEYPIAINLNEGILIRTTFTTAATGTAGTWTFRAAIKWMETPYL